MEILTVAGLAAFAGKVASTLKQLSAGGYRAALTQALVWAAGVGLAFLAASANAMADLAVVGDLTLGQLDDSSTVLWGLGLASTISVAYDFRKAVDSSDSAREPSLAVPAPNQAGNGVVTLLVVVILVVVLLKLVGAF